MGPLAGIRVVELAAIGPVPFCGMVLADMGADVVRIDRLAERPKGRSYSVDEDIIFRGIRSVSLDLKHPDGAAVVLDLVERADVLLEGFRPGVAERLGVGPDDCLARNPRLVYGRMTGWGQEGPYAQMAGHDVNYIALTGTLHSMGPAGAPPLPPLNLVGDYGGGAMMLAFGVACALLEAKQSGRGQVIDAAMIDGAALLSTVVFSSRAMGEWNDERGHNLLDGGAHFYQVYETSDGGYVTIGAIEPEFYARLIGDLDLPADELPEQWDVGRWPEMKERFAAVFRTRTRDEWCQTFEGTDVCFAPVLTVEEASVHPQIRHRGTLVERHGVVQPAPAPRFSRTPGELGRSAPRIGQHTTEALVEYGLDPARVEELVMAGVARQASQP